MESVASSLMWKSELVANHGQPGRHGAFRAASLRDRGQVSNEEPWSQHAKRTCACESAESQSVGVKRPAHSHSAVSPRPAHSHSASVDLSVLATLPCLSFCFEFSPSLLESTDTYLLLCCPHVCLVCSCHTGAELDCQRARQTKQCFPLLPSSWSSG
jgi:hypothetical protein